MAWTDDDREYALAWQELQDETCPGCGQPRAESFHPDSDGAYEVRALRCHACSAKDDRSKDIVNNEDADTGGLYLTVKRRH